MRDDSDVVVAGPVRYTKEEWDRVQLQRRFHFAKWCEKHGRESVFLKAEGISIAEFKRKIKQAQKISAERKAKR